MCLLRRCNPRIPGLSLSLVVSPVHRYADDTTFILSTDNSILEKVSGSPLNQSKSLMFDFFWKTKCKLVSRIAVVQLPSIGGFSIVNVKLKSVVT